MRDGFVLKRVIEMENAGFDGSPLGMAFQRSRSLFSKNESQPSDSMILRIQDRFYWRLEKLDREIEIDNTEDFYSRANLTISLAETCNVITKFQNSMSIRKQNVYTRTLYTVCIYIGNFFLSL